LVFKRPLGGENCQPPPKFVRGRTVKESNIRSPGERKEKGPSRMPNLMLVSQAKHDEPSLKEWNTSTIKKVIGGASKVPL